MTDKREDLRDFDSFSFDAMNTTFYFAITECKIPDWKEVMQGWVRYVEKEWSRFREDNELGQVNQLGIGQEVVVSPPLLDVLLRADEYRKKTKGLFSPYLLPQMQFHGYEKSFPFHTGKTMTQDMPVVYDKETSPFLIEPNKRTVTRLTEGQIDLGGIGKGYTVQAAARWLNHIGGASTGMVDGGGDITVWSEGEKKWKIGVADPFQNDMEIAQLRVKNACIATSNVLYRSWKQGNEIKHHILNGRTGLPAESQVIQATVIAENCLDAEVGAKLCLIEDETNLRAQLNQISPACSFLLVNKQGKILVS